MSDVILPDCNKITFSKFKRYPNLESKSRKQENVLVFFFDQGHFMTMQQMSCSTINSAARRCIVSVHSAAMYFSSTLIIDKNFHVILSISFFNVTRDFSQNPFLGPEDVSLLNS